MPAESELRRQFHDDEPRGTIDLDAVLRRARRRRAPRVAAIAIVSSLAVVGVVVPVSIGLTGAHTTTSVLGAQSGGSAPDLSSGQAPRAADGGAAAGTSAETMNRCAGHLANPSPAADGLVLTVPPVNAAAGGRSIPVTVTLTNTGTQQVTGSLSPFPVLTLSRDGLVLWHSNGAVPSLVQEIDLAPGASTTFKTTFEPLICAPADDTGRGFGSALAQVARGSYELSAALDFTPAPSSGEAGGAAVVVTGPTSAVTLH